ncbi:hypothetical protein PInf_014516 [Phytophthora infestans]|nr:hypothetical protein PInf_014516 [Phytophthora infestans]
MSMRDYVQKTRHLASCIVTKPIDMASQVHVFVFGMREGMTRYCLTRAEPSSFEEAFALAIREDYMVAASYTAVIPAEAQESTPESMEIDAINASIDRRRGTYRGSAGGSNRSLIFCGVPSWTSDMGLDELQPDNTLLAKATTIGALVKFFKEEEVGQEYI